jgi:hypothetical protein
MFGTSVGTTTTPTAGAGAGVPQGAVGSFLGNLIQDPNVQQGLITAAGTGLSRIGSGGGSRAYRRQLRRQGRRVAKAQGLRGREKRTFIANYVAQAQGLITPTGGVNPASMSNIPLPKPQQQSNVRGGISFGQQPLGNFVILALIIGALTFIFRR